MSSLIQRMWRRKEFRKEIPRGQRNGEAFLEGNMPCRLLPSPYTPQHAGSLGRISPGDYHDISSYSPVESGLSLIPASPCWGARGMSLSLTQGSSPCSNLVISLGLKSRYPAPERERSAECLPDPHSRPRVCTERSVFMTCSQFQSAGFLPTHTKQFSPTLLGSHNSTQF